MLDTFPMDQIGANTLRELPIRLNMQADTVKMAIKKLTDTLEKHMQHFQCQQNLNAKKFPI